MTALGIKIESLSRNGILPYREFVTKSYWDTVFLYTNSLCFVSFTHSWTEVSGVFGRDILEVTRLFYQLQSDTSVSHGRV